MIDEAERYPDSSSSFGFYEDWNMLETEVQHSPTRTFKDFKTEELAFLSKKLYYC